MKYTVVAMQYGDVVSVTKTSRKGVKGMVADAVREADWYDEGFHTRDTEVKHYGDGRIHVRVTERGPKGKTPIEYWFVPGTFNWER